MARRKRSPLSIAACAAAWSGYVFLALPSVIIIPMSFGNSDELIFPPRSFSLYLYEKYLLESNWMAATAESLEVALGTAALSLLLGVSAAYGLSRAEFLAKRLITMFLLSPAFVPAIVLALGLYLYLGAGHVSGTTVGLIISHTVVAVPFVIVTSMAGLRHVDQRLEIAAAVMGARRFLIIRRITLPLLAPSVLAATLFAFLISFDEVVISYFIAGVRTQTLPVKMYSAIHWEISPVLAAVSTLLTLLSLGICLAVALLRRGR
ncbi:MAG TPA: ABC transporter permease [Stellaceae bacterium]|nr:ABC transporter permease [Stellaceae bacterium]